MMRFHNGYLKRFKQLLVVTVWQCHVGSMQGCFHDTAADGPTYNEGQIIHPEVSAST